METADTFFTSKWKINYSFCENNVSVTATDNEGWYHFSYKGGSDIILALEKITSKVVDQFLEIHSKAFDKYVIRQEDKFNRLRDTYELVIQEIPCDRADKYEIVNVNHIPTWTIIYRETSNTVWLLRASDLDGNSVTVHDSASSPEDSIKKLIIKFLGKQLKPKTATVSGLRRRFAIAEASTEPFRIVISADWDRILKY